MDDKRFLASFFRILLIAGLVIASTVGHCLEHISLKQISELASRFNQNEQMSVEPASIDQFKTLDRSRWNCEMYGAQSRLQVRRDAKLYQFESTASGDIYFNRGSHILSQYKPTEQGLMAKTDRFIEIVKIKNHNQLISRLSTNSESPLIVSYAICVRI